MTCYVNRGYEIADAFRARGVPVVMGGVHPSFMPQEALKHCDAVVIGEAELVLDKLLDDLERGEMRGTYKSDRLHPMEGLPMPRYDLIKKNRYVNRTFVQTSRGCHQGCTFCAEPLMNGLKFRYRPVEEVIREVESCGSRMISINDADFFGTPERPKEVMRALKGRGIHWQAGVTSKLAQDDRMLELAAESGCTLLSIGFESITRSTLTSVHKHVNRPETFAALVEKVHSYGIMVFGLFMFGFDGDDGSVFEETARFNIGANYDACAYSVLTPYPGTLTWYEMKKADRIVSFDWAKYDQANVVYRPAQMSGDELRLGSERRLRDVLRAIVHRPSLPAPRRAKSAPVVHLQSIHEEGCGDRAQGGGGRADRRRRMCRRCRLSSRSSGSGAKRFSKGQERRGLILHNRQALSWEL